MGSSRVMVPLRRALFVRGLVQGLGFRPQVFRAAARFGLAGFVRNESDGLRIEVEGDPAGVEAFVDALRSAPPPGACVSELRSSSLAPRGEKGFRIAPSVATAAAMPSVAPDLATCDDCLRDLRGPGGRRRGYAFTACASCGPRFTVVEAAPYDRERTAMAAFPLCAACRAEYEDPEDRRFHAESTSCAACGPRLSMGVEEAGARLREGRILSIKGLGGFHLACDARREDVVRELRRRKGRDEKPFAVMTADPSRYADVGPEEEALLRSPERPIVLLRRKSGAPGIAGGVAPGNPLLGLMLPYTPLHRLLLEAAGGPLVMTSANPSDEPIARDEAELRGTADAVLTHDRAILARCDDSVARVLAGAPLLLRRSRGYAPAPLELPLDGGEPLLALGGAQKAVFALGRGREAILSQHLGDLESYAGYRAYAAEIARFETLFQHAPARLVHDLHPDYPSTRYAIERGLPRVAVQHHHAHLASCLAENGVADPVIGVTFDGSGLGTDGAIWGGEFLVGDLREVRRAAHLETVGMPGGEAAVREPWRMAAAYLAKAGLSDVLLRGRVPERSLDVVRRLRGPSTSSMGRLFDGVASLIGLRDRVSYEGQAAIELEWRAATSRAGGRYPVEFSPAGTILLAPVIGAIVEEVGRGRAAADVARRFHATVVEMILRTCERLRAETGLGLVALSGGVFMNEILLAGAVEALEAAGFRVLRHRRVPPNDGGLCLGQLAVAAAGGGSRTCA